MKINVCEKDICYTCRCGSQSQCAADIDDVFLNDTGSICDCRKYEKQNCYKEIVDYLNKKLGTNYRASGKGIRKLIDARMNEGYKIADFKKVIDNKYASWHSSEVMCQHLVPSTLFGTKFYQYLNEISYKPADNLASSPSYDLDAINRRAMENTDIS